MKRTCRSKNSGARSNHRKVPTWHLSASIDLDVRLCFVPISAVVLLWPLQLFLTPMQKYITRKTCASGGETRGCDKMLKSEDLRRSCTAVELLLKYTLIWSYLQLCGALLTALIQRVLSVYWTLYILGSPTIHLSSLTKFRVFHSKASYELACDSSIMIPWQLHCWLQCRWHLLLPPALSADSHRYLGPAEGTREERFQWVRASYLAYYFLVYMTRDMCKWEIWLELPVWPLVALCLCLFSDQWWHGWWFCRSHPWDSRSRRGSAQSPHLHTPPLFLWFAVLNVGDMADTVNEDSMRSL